jgi:hypothetical protein
MIALATRPSDTEIEPVKRKNAPPVNARLRPGRWGLGKPRSARAMPIDQHRRDEITATVAAYDDAHLLSPLPHSTVRLLAAMCQRSLQDLAAEGLDRKRLSMNLRRLMAAGFMSRTPGSGSAPDTYRLHLTPVQR